MRASGGTPVTTWRTEKLPEAATSEPSAPAGSSSTPSSAALKAATHSGERNRGTAGGQCPAAAASAGERFWRRRILRPSHATGS